MVELSKERVEQILHEETMKKESEYSIIVKDVHKRFKLVYDKPFTLKERLVF